MFEIQYKNPTTGRFKRPETPITGHTFALARQRGWKFFGPPNARKVLDTGNHECCKVKEVRVRNLRTNETFAI